MSTRPLRFSERQQIAETGSLGALAHDDVPRQLRVVLRYTLAEIARSDVGSDFSIDLRRACVEHFGLPSDQVIEVCLTGALAEFLDFVEIIADECASPRFYYMHAGRNRVFSDGTQHKRSFRPALADFQERFNGWAERHRFGYRFESGAIRRIGSPALSQQVVGPALIATRRDGWEQVEQSYKEALLHQRAGADENDDALTAANAALEAALKAVGLRGEQMSTLTKSLRGSTLVPAQLERVPELLDDLLKRSAAVRNVHGDAHGKPPGSPDVPQALVDLAIYWAGAFIVYLAETAPGAGPES